MNSKNKTRIYSILLLGFLAIIIVSCKKDEFNSDFAGATAGTYNGTITVSGIGSASASSKLSRSSDTIVNLVITIGANTVPLDGISVTSSISNVYNLTLTDVSGSFTGTVQGNKLDWTMTSGAVVEVFTGTK